MSIENYKFSDDDMLLLSNLDDDILHLTIRRGSIGSILELNRLDVIAMAKHFKLTAHDIECTEYQALCADLNQVDEDHFDELVEIQANKIKINKSIN